MARKNLIAVEPQEQVNVENDKGIKTTELLKLIPQYGEIKSIVDEKDKIAKSQNAQIKSLMSELKMDSITSEGWKVTYSVSDRTTMNEDKLLELLKSDWSKKNGSMECPYIKMKPYVDMEALEAAIYEDKIDKDILVKMKDCEDVKKVETLRITKVKEKDNGKEN